MNEDIMKERFMEIAWEEAQQAFQEDEVPVGACIVSEGEVIARSHNQREKRQEVTAHAEIIAINRASQILGSWRLSGAFLFVTLEPCPMCAGAIIQARIKKVFFGARDPKWGAAGRVINVFDEKLFPHCVEIEGGILEDKCSEILKNYFKLKRGEVAEGMKALDSKSSRPC